MKKLVVLAAVLALCFVVSPVFAAGTLADQATLANDNAFIAKCRVELLKLCITIDAGTGGHAVAVRNLASNVLSNSQSYAERIAWLIATGNSTVAAAAPAVPADADMAYVVNEAFPRLR